MVVLPPRRLAHGSLRGEIFRLFRKSQGRIEPLEPGLAEAAKQKREEKKMSEKAAATQTTLETVPVKADAPQDLLERVQKAYEEIANRAFFIFKDDGIFGNDLDNWLKAETELLRPMRVKITEADGAVNIEAEVPGFKPKDLEVTLEPHRLIISGKRETKEESTTGKAIYKEQSSNEILRAIPLPFEVEAAKATATLKNGMLELHAPKSAKATTAKVQVQAA